MARFGGVVLAVWLAGACSGNAFSPNSGDAPEAGSAGMPMGEAGTGKGGAAAGASGNGGQVGKAGAGGGTSPAGSDAGGSAGMGGEGGGDEPGLCPAAEPIPGSPCEIENLLCQYGLCCPNEAFCSGGKWLLEQATCEEPVCPQTPPEPGADCRCELGLQCLYGCVASEQRTVTACGATGEWSTSVAECGRDSFLCGNSTCLVGQICLTTIAPGPTVKRACSDNNPCGNQPIQCSCAASLCDEKLCTDSPGATIICGV
jgi:hypothetical protein